jgi:HlyD family secretion protein
MNTSAALLHPCLSVCIRGFLLAGLLMLSAGCGSRPESGERLVAASNGTLTVWSSYPGKLEARRVENILSRFNGSATIVEMAPEGTQVNAGDLLVRFDSSAVERDLLNVERTCATAAADLERMEKAELPLELRDLEAQLLEAQGNYESEFRYLEDSRQLVAEELVSPQELEQQKLKVEELKAKKEKLTIQLDLTKRYLHPNALARARATQAAAELELKMIRTQFSNCTVTAPAPGVVVYRPLHVGGEYRTARVGDGIFKNQPFMILPDMRELVVECQIPEAELARVEIGREVTITPLSYPDLRLHGQVESVGSMASAVADRPAWQRYFRVLIGLKDNDARLRSGMSVMTQILSCQREQALLIPRLAVRREGDAVYVWVDQKGRRERRPVVLGWADLHRYEVIEGLAPGDQVVVP